MTVGMRLLQRSEVRSPGDRVTDSEVKQVKIEGEQGKQKTEGEYSSVEVR